MSCIGDISKWELVKQLHFFPLGYTCWMINTRAYEKYSTAYDPYNNEYLQPYNCPNYLY